MAKKVTTFGSANKSYRDHKRNTIPAVIITLLVIILVVVLSAVSYNSIKERAKTEQVYEQTKNEDDSLTTKSVEQAKPSNIQLSGAGQSSSEQFELPAGNYLVKYSFNKNLSYYGSFSEGTNFISEIKCSDGFSLGISNAISGEGTGSEYLTIDMTKKCFYQVEKASPSSSWSISISSS